MSNRPDFILDLGADLTGRNWTIRKWAEAEKDVEKAGGYGIISYAWGKWHDKSVYELGGTIGNENPNGYPTFNIGVSTIESENGPDLYDRTNNRIRTFDAPAPRKIPKGTPLSWIFPKVYPINPDNSIASRNQEVFTISQVRTALCAMKTRFVWWDWACIPQGWNKDWRPGQAGPTLPKFRQHDELTAVAESSMNKMRHFYPASVTGCLWWHETSWSGQGGQSRNINDLVQLLTPITSMRNVNVNQAKTLVSLLTSATRSESSLQSLWSFQEAVLFTSTARPPAKAGSTTTSYAAPSVVLDKQGQPYVVAAAGDHTALIFQHGQFNLEDMTNAATLFANVISGSLIGYGAKAQAGEISPLAEWCLKPENQSEARGLLAQLINTGFVGLRFDSPLMLLEARFGRDIRPDQSDIDVAVYTVMGAVSVDLTREQETIKSIVKNGAYANADLETYNRMRQTFIGKLFELYQWRMLLFARGAVAVAAAAPAGGNPTIWETLAGTKRSKTAALTTYIDPDQPLSASYGPSAKGKDSNTVDNLPKLIMLINQAHPPLACTFTGSYELFDYGVPGTKYTGWTRCVFYEYVETQPGWLPAGSIPPPPANVPAPPFYTSGTIQPKRVFFPDREKDLGPNLMLFPFQKSVEQPPILQGDQSCQGKTWLRCFVMVRNNPNNANELTFRGVGDFFEIKDVAAKPSGKQMTIL